MIQIVVRVFLVFSQALLFVLACIGSANAALLDSGQGTILDTETQLVWLKDWGIATSTNWSNQDAWARNLTFAGSDAWVLPDINQYEVLYTHAGGLSGLTTTFNNVSIVTWPTISAYWSSTPFVTTASHWAFFSVGFNAMAKLGDNSVASHFGVAVHAVSEPPVWALFLLGGIASAAIARRRVFAAKE